MKPEVHIYLIAAVTLAVGCGEIDFDPQLSRAKESPAYASRQVSPPSSHQQAKPKNEETVQSPKTPEEPPAKAVKPAPAPVTPSPDKSLEDPVEKPSTLQPDALPEISKTSPIGAKTKETKETKKTKEDTLKLISDDPDKNLEVLNTALGRWIAEKGAMPERLEQLVMEQYLPMLPMEPIGKRFAIDPDKKIIILVGQ